MQIGIIDEVHWVNTPVPVFGTLKYSDSRSDTLRKIPS